MKKIIACMAVLLLCASLFIPAAAAEDFTPSVTNKPAPEIVPIPTPDGGEAIGVICDAEGKVLDYVMDDCLVVTAVADAATSTLIPDYAEELLLDVYAKLTSGEMTLPYEKHDSELNTGNMVIRDLFDATFLCGEHPEMLLPEGVVLKITFDLNVDADVEVYTMTYKNDQWDPIVETVNNGDGTVTCTFEGLCPVEFSVRTEKTPSQTGDIIATQLPIWGMVAIFSLLAIAVLALIYRRDAKNAR